ncbi:MAG TPA: M20 family metallopeptidase [Candidatus Limnocylindrales bacterium]|nr:M20 family metallopeptidase [Candidatus Limnocylindrales bacterium]
MTIDRRSVADDLVSAAELDGLRARFDGELPAFLADLERLCSIDCGSYTPAGVNRVAAFVAAFLSGIGARVERRPDPDGRYGDTVIATIDGRPGAGARLLLIGHMDTVFDEGTVTARPFRIDDGIARGPGVTDMKGGLLAGLYAVRAVAEASRGRSGPADAARPFERLVFVANPDEEIGSPTSTPHIREIAATSDACLVLECARANGDFVSARKGIVDLRVTIHGRAAHAGVEPEKGRNAIVAGANLVRGIQALNGRWPDVTANVGVFTSGTRPNVIPDRAELQVDVRGMTRASLDGALAAVHEVVAAPGVPDVTTDVETMASWMPMEKLERSGRLVEHAIGLAARLGFATKDTATGGASDANTTSGMGVPSIDGLGPVGGLDHSPDEYLEVASIVPRTALVAALLLAIGRDPVVADWRSARAGGGPSGAAG